MSLSVYANSLEATLRQVISWSRDSYRTNKAGTTAAAAAAVLLLLTPAVRRDYKMYMSYGPGGLPYNVVGWFASGVLLKSMAIGADVIGTDLYDKNPDKRSFLPAGFPPRPRGERPDIGPHPLPQRQLNQPAPKKIKEMLVREFEKIVRDNQDIIDYRDSVHEGRTKSLFIKKDQPQSAATKMMLGEISHIHGTGDYSVHVVLAPQDCKKVIASGWGQRHPLDGVRASKLVLGWWVPKEYVLVYAPRNEEEVQIVVQIVKAAVGYMTGRYDVK